MPSTSTILVIDDEKLLRQSLALILQEDDYSVTTAGHAVEARQYLQAGAYDLVFLDLKMPDVDGLTLLAEIRARYPEMPVLILTAHATLETAMEAVRQGARDYLLKPPVILNRVREILAERQVPRRRREIATQLHELVSELHHLEDEDTPSRDAAPAASTPSDPARFLRRGPLTLDLHTRCLSLDDRQINLPPSTFDYLVTLVRHSPNPISFETLVEESQGFRVSRIEARETARIRIHELRKALETDMRRPKFIITVRHVGYRLVT